MRPRARWTVAVTGMNSRPENPGPGAAVARCLRQSPDFRGRLVGLGYDVLDPGLHDPGVCDSSYLLPYPAAGPEPLLERLLDIHEDDPLDAVIPCLDAELPGFLDVAPELEARGIRTFLPSRQALKSRSKDRLPALGRAAGVAVPETLVVPGPGFFDEPNRQYPLVVKGPFYDAEVAWTPTQARLAYDRLARQWGHPVLVQRYVEGQEFDLAALGDGRGGLVAPVMMRKQALTDKGKAWAGISIDDQELEAMAGRLVAALQWRGPLEVEALRDPEGRLHLLEINPRFPAWIYLSHGVGRSLPPLLLRLMDGEDRCEVPPARPGTMFIRHAEELIVDLQSFESLVVAGCRDHGTRVEAPAA